MSTLSDELSKKIEASLKKDASKVATKEARDAIALSIKKTVQSLIKDPKFQSLITKECKKVLLSELPKAIKKDIQNAKRIEWWFD